MLRIMISPTQGGNEPPNPKPDQMQASSNPAESPEEPDVDEAGGPPDQDVDDSGQKKVDQSVVVYMGGEYGPFRCDHCEYFQAPGSCAIVAGTIDPAGCCNLYESIDQGNDQGEGEPEEGPTDELTQAPDESAMGAEAENGQ